MKNVCLSIALTVSAQYVYADEENVLVTGSRIPYESAGLVWSGGGTPSDPDYGCVEKDCGNLPNDPSGGGSTSHAAKGARNKQAKQQVQKKKAVVATPIRNTKQQSEQSIWTTIREWFDGSVTHTTLKESESQNGKILKDTSCTHVDFSKEKGPNPCVTKSIDVEKVQKANGDITNQLLLTFEVYEECYYAKQCAPYYISFIAENQTELNNLLNDALGEKFF